MEYEKFIREMDNFSDEELEDIEDIVTILLSRRYPGETRNFDLFIQDIEKRKTLKIGDRFKDYYENPFRFYLPKKIPVIARLDGKCFHTLMEKLEPDNNNPFSENFHICMIKSIIFLMEHTPCIKLAYTQSDEVSFLISDLDSLKSKAWFNYNVQKMSSILSAELSSIFTYNILCVFVDKSPNLFISNNDQNLPVFDCRVFSIPEDEVYNYFLWRQRDWERNSLSMFCLHSFNHKDLYGKNKSQQHEMLYEKGLNWAKDCSDWQKNGTFIFKGKDTIKEISNITLGKIIEKQKNFSELFCKWKTYKDFMDWWEKILSD